MAVTSRDVARVAGVTQPTVSRALRGLPGVSEATRQRIREVAEALGYVPMETGRSLVTRKTGRIGIVADELSNPYYTSLVAPLHGILERAGYRTLLLVDRPENPLAIETLMDGSLDGVILTTSHRASRVPVELSARGIPVVLVGREVDGVEADTCVVDNARGAAVMADFLLDLGHRYIGALFGPEWTSSGHDREKAFRKRLKTRGAPLEDNYVIHGLFDYATGYEGLGALMRRNQTPTALFCANDVIAIGACNAARAHGVSIPDQLTLVGFDDVPLSSWEVFQLTTIRTDLQALANEACNLLVRRIRHPHARPRRIVIPVELVERATHRSVPALD